MSRLIDADAFCGFLREVSTRQHYETLLTKKDKYPTVADVIEEICCELDGTGLKGFDNAPTVDTTFRELVAYECGKNDRPKGKWIEYDEDELYTGECSCCKWKALLYESNVLNMNFCPNCGADMRSVDKGLHERAVCDLSKTVDDLYKKLRGEA